MHNFSEHKFIKNDDGTYNILDVPVFELGKHRGFEYTEDWAQDALSNFGSLKEKKFLPRVIIGHTSKDSEKPAVGFLDNLKLKGKTFHADLSKLAEKTFNEIKSKAWPSRSVEVNPNKKKFTALALLGGTEPYFQFEPIDVKFEADPDGQWVEFSEPDIDKIADSVWSRMLEFFKQSKKIEEPEMTKEEVEKLIADSKADMQTEFENKFKERYNQQFKEEFGMSPDEFKQKREADKAELFKEKKASVVKKLKEAGLAPAIVDGFMEPIMGAIEGHEDETLKFAEKEEGTMFALIEKMGEAIKNAAEKNTLVVDFEEHANGGDNGDNGNFRRDGKATYLEMTAEERVALDQKAVKYMKDNKIKTYDEALMQVMEQENL